MWVKEEGCYIHLVLITCISFLYGGLLAIVRESAKQGLPCFCYHCDVNDTRLAPYAWFQPGENFVLQGGAVVAYGHRQGGGVSGVGGNKISH